MTSEARRTQLRRRYLSLGMGELVAAAIFAAVAAWVFSPRLEAPNDVRALWSALIPLLAILVQGGAYWLCARRWVKRSGMPAPLVAFFRLCRVLDVALLALGLAGVIVWWPSSVPVALGVLAIWVFGVIEYANYFVVRLAYPPSQWFQAVRQGRTPRLARDIRAH